MCSTRLAGNTGRKNDTKSRHLGPICRAVSSQLRHVSTIGKTCSNTSSTCSYNMVNFGPLVADILSLVWGTPANFNAFRVLASLLQRRRSTEVNQTLHNVWPSPGLVHYIYTFGISCLLTEFCHHRPSFSGYIFTTKASIDNRKQLTKQQYVLQMTPQYGELRLASGWDRSGSLGHPCKFQRVSRLGSVTARHSSSGRQPNFVALNRGHHL